MANPKLRLVYSSVASDKADQNRTEWGFENARQLSLFEDLDIIRIFMVPISDISAHAFKRERMRLEPKLAIDARMFPDFFSVFTSTEMALKAFESEGIEYCRVSLSTSKEQGREWSKWSELKNILRAYLEKRTGAPIFVLTSNKKIALSLSKQLEGYLSQEGTNTKFEKILG